MTFSMFIDVRHFHRASDNRSFQVKCRITTQSRTLEQFLNTSHKANSAWLHVVSIHSDRSTCSGSFKPSNTRNRTLNRSNHHRCSQDAPCDLINSKRTVKARVRTSNLQRLNILDDFLFIIICLFIYLMTAESSNMSGNHPRSQTRSSIGISATSSPLKHSIIFIFRSYKGTLEFWMHLD